MRIPTYMSYSSWSTFKKDKEEFYLKYLSAKRPDRLPQERPASVGSAFDAYVKSDFHEKLYGTNADPKYGLQALFEAQVEPQNRDWAWDAGRYVFECYKVAGQYDTLLELLKKSTRPPRMEVDIKGPVEGVPFLAKPDLEFALEGPIEIVLDWKVNGFCGKANTSPNKGYMLCRDGFVDKKQNKSHDTAHKQFVALDFHGFKIDAGYMEDCSTDWAEQLSLYGWALGKKLADPNVIISVDQVVAKAVIDSPPALRVSSYRARVRKSFQEYIATSLRECWATINSGHIFTDMTREQNDERMAVLDGQGLQTSTGSEYDSFFNEAVRPAYRG